MYGSHNPENLTTLTTDQRYLSYEHVIFLYTVINIIRILLASTQLFVPHLILSLLMVATDTFSGCLVVINEENTFSCPSIKSPCHTKSNIMTTLQVTYVSNLMIACIACFFSLDDNGLDINPSTRNAVNTTNLGLLVALTLYQAWYLVKLGFAYCKGQQKKLEQQSLITANHVSVDQPLPSGGL